MTAPLAVATYANLKTFSPGLGLPTITPTFQTISDQTTLDAVIAAAQRSEVRLRYSTDPAPAAPGPDPSEIAALAAALALSATYRPRAGFATPSTATTGTLSAGAFEQVDATAANCARALAAGTRVDDEITVKLTATAAGHTLTITDNVGVSYTPLDTAGQSITFVWTGTAWVGKGRDNPPGYFTRFPLAANNLSDLASAATARTNLGLGTAATQPSTAFDPAGAAAAVTTTSIGAATTGALATTNGNVTTAQTTANAAVGLALVFGA